MLAVLANADGMINSKELANETGLARRYSENALQLAVHAGLLVGERGPKGGYKLTPKAMEMPVINVLETLKPPLDSKSSDPSLPEHLEEKLSTVEDAVASVLGEFKVRDLVRPQETGQDQGPDYGRSWARPM